MAIAGWHAANGIGYTNGCTTRSSGVDDWSRAQELADRLSPDQLHRTLDRYAERCCPVSGGVRAILSLESLMQVEYSYRSGIPFHASSSDLSTNNCVRELVLSVKAEQVASFLGQSDHAIAGPGDRVAVLYPYRGNLHQAPVSANARSRCSDKVGIVLRIETTTNDVSFFKHHRKVEHRQGPPTRELGTRKEESSLQPDRPARHPPRL